MEANGITWREGYDPEAVWSGVSDSALELELFPAGTVEIVARRNCMDITLSEARELHAMLSALLASTVFADAEAKRLQKLLRRKAS
jgi:hypothetical protein